MHTPYIYIYIYTSKYYVNTCIYICMNLSISCVPICIPNIPNYIPCFIVFGSYRILLVVYHYIVKIPPILVYYIIIYIYRSHQSHITLPNPVLL